MSSATSVTCMVSGWHVTDVARDEYDIMEGVSRWAERRETCETEPVRAGGMVRDIQNYN